MRPTSLLHKQDYLHDSLLCSLIPVSPDSQILGADWSLVPLIEVVPSADYGISSPLASDGNGIPTLRMNNLVSGRIRIDDIKFATAGVPGDLILRKRDVLFNRTNSFEHVGRTAIWRGELDRATFASYLVRLNPDPRRLIPEYLVRWLNHPAIQQRIRRIATPGVQQVNINPTSLRKIPIELPVDISRQAEVARILNECDQAADRIRAELECLKLVKQGLMDDLVTGRVRVTLVSS
jgi:type I restriction enzyme S subunit